MKLNRKEFLELLSKLATLCVLDNVYPALVYAEVFQQSVLQNGEQDSTTNNSQKDEEFISQENISNIQAASDQISKAVKELSNVVDSEIHSLKKTGHDLVIFIGDALNSTSATIEIKSYIPYINKATLDPYKRDLMKAISYEEQVHQTPFEKLIENNLSDEQSRLLGVGDSVGPSQIRVSLWAEKYNASRQEIIDPQSHFPIMAKHLEFVIQHLESKHIPSAPEWVGTLWNNLNADKVSDYGRRVQKYFDRISTSPEFNPSP